MEFTPIDPDLIALKTLLKALPDVVETKTNLSSIFKSIRQKMNQGLFYEDILDFVFSALDEIIPYDRIGIALLEEEGTKIRLSWVRSKLTIHSLKKDYLASMKNSSLQKLIDSEHPRIINDLKLYLSENPGSRSTQLALLDGIHSSLTCPLILDGKPLGVIFFSSAKTSTYAGLHVELFSEIASGLALIIEQGLNKKSRERVDSKEKIFRDTIHDLNNPLTVIKLTLDLLAKKKWFQDMPEDSKKTFEILRRNCEAMVKLTSELTYAKENEVAEKPPLPVIYPLSLLLKDILTDSEIMAKKKNIEVKLTLGPELPELVSLDPGKIKESVENLISNAIKYSKENTTILIHVSSSSDRKILSLTVKDHGQGIPTEEIPKLFTEFGTTSVRPTANEPSRGLGLANVKRMVLAHGGDVFVTTEVGVGSSFGFWIPI